MSTLSDLRKKTDDELVDYIGGWKTDSRNYLAGMIELRRRQDRPNQIRGWIAIFLSIVAICVSVTALFSRLGYFAAQ